MFYYCSKRIVCFISVFSQPASQTLSDKQLCELLNTKTEVSLNLLKYEEIGLDKKIRVYSLRNRRTQFGVKILMEVDGGYLFLPARYTDLFIKEGSTENFFMKTATLSVTITDFHNEVIENENFITPVLVFTTDNKRAYPPATGAVKKTPSALSLLLTQSSSNSSVDALASTSKQFTEAKNSQKGKVTRRVTFEEKKNQKTNPESQAWTDSQVWCEEEE